MGKKLKDLTKPKHFCGELLQKRGFVIVAKKQILVLGALEGLIYLSSVYQS